jgi:hypothetical protein
MLWVCKNTEREFNIFQKRLSDFMEDHKDLVPDSGLSSLTEYADRINDFINNKPMHNMNESFDKLIEEFIFVFTRCISKIDSKNINKKVLMDILYLTQNFTRFADMCLIMDINADQFHNQVMLSSSQSTSKREDHAWISSTALMQFDEFENSLTRFLVKYKSLQSDIENKFKGVMLVMAQLRKFIFNCPEKDLNVSFAQLSGVMQVQLTMALAAANCEDPEYLTEVFQLCHQFTKFADYCLMLDVDPIEKKRMQEKEALSQQKSMPIATGKDVKEESVAISVTTESEKIDIRQTGNPDIEKGRIQNETKIEDTVNSHDDQSVRLTSTNHGIFKRACRMVSGAGIMTLGLGYLGLTYLSQTFDEKMQDVLHQDDTGVPHQAIIPTTLILFGMTVFATGIKCQTSNQNTEATIEETRSLLSTAYQ